MRQENATASGGAAGDTLSATGGTTDVTTTRISPFVRYHFGAYADLEARIGVDQVDNSDSAVGSQTRRAAVTVSSGRRFARLPWSLAIDHSKQANDSGGSTTFQRLTGSVTYVYSRRLSVNLGAGFERNEFASADGGDGSSLTWSAGVTWRPTPRSSFAAGLERRPFGTAFFMDSTHRMRRMVFSSSYREDLTTTSTLQLERRLVALEDPFGDPILDPDSGEAILIPIDTPTLTDEVITQKQFTYSMSYRGRRGGATLSLNRSERTTELSRGESTVTGLSASANHTLSRRTSANASASLTTTESGGGSETTRTTFSLGLSHSVNQDLHASVNLQRLSEDSDGASADIDENRISVQLGFNF
jgi:uncharacterized protein (PEP-CTERM system associated)